MPSLIAQLLDTEDAEPEACGCAWESLLEEALREAVSVLSSRPTPEQAIDAVIDLRAVLRGLSDARRLAADNPFNLDAPKHEGRPLALS